MTSTATLPASGAPPKRSVADISRWIVRDLAQALNVSEQQVDPAAPLDTLGIDSLTAIGLTCGLSAWLGRELPATLMWDHASIAAIAHSLGTQQKTELPQGIVALQPLGDQTPIFFFPGIGGHPVSFTRLAKTLGQTRPCYGLIAPGLNEGESPLATVEEITAAMLVNLRKVQPRGPYLLAGYSFGGFLAYEAAQQLTAVGERVDLLAIYDTYTHHGRAVRPLWQRLLVHVYLLATGKNRMRYLWQRLRRLMGCRDNLSACTPETSDILAQRVHRSHNKAIANYRPLQYSSELVFFRAMERYWQDAFYARATDGGWGKLCRQVNMIELAGAHHTILSPTHAPEAAIALQNILKPIQ